MEPTTRGSSDCTSEKSLLMQRLCDDELASVLQWLTLRELCKFDTSMGEKRGRVKLLRVMSSEAVCYERGDEDCRGYMKMPCLAWLRMRGVGVQRLHFNVMLKNKYCANGFIDKTFKQMSNLTDVSCSGWCKDDVLVTLSEHCHRIVSVNFSGCADITDTGITMLAKGCPLIRNLVLAFCRKISDIGVKALALGCRSIISIDLNTCELISDDAITLLAMQCPLIETVNLSSCPKVSNVSIKALSVGCRLIKVLLLRCTGSCMGRISDDAIELLVERCPLLQILDLDNQYALTDKTINAVAMHSKQIRILRLQDCRINHASFDQLGERCLFLESVMVGMHHEHHQKEVDSRLYATWRMERKQLYQYAARGNVDDLKLLLKQGGAAFINCAYDRYGTTALCAASAAGRTAVVKALLSMPDIDFNRGSEISPLYIASQNGHTEVVKALLAMPGILLNNTYRNGDTPLGIASMNGHTDVVQALLNMANIDVNESQWGYTPLYRTVCNKKCKIEVVKTLLTKPGIDINKAHPSLERTPLWEAAFNGHTEIVKTLLDMPGIDVNKTNKSDRDGDGLPPLYWAIYRGTAEMAKTLLAMPGINVNKAHDRSLPLHWAINKDNTEIVKTLLDMPGIDVNKEDKYRNTPLRLAKNEEIRNLLSARGATA